MGKLQEKYNIIILPKRKRGKTGFKSDHEYMIHLVNDIDGKIGIVFMYGGRMMGFVKGYGTLNKAAQFLQAAGRCFGNYFQCGGGVYIQDDRHPKRTMYCMYMERVQGPIALREVDYIKFHKKINGQKL